MIRVEEIDEIERLIEPEEREGARPVAILGLLPSLLTTFNPND